MSSTGLTHLTKPNALIKTSTLLMKPTSLKTTTRFGCYYKPLRKIWPISVMYSDQSQATFLWPTGFTFYDIPVNLIQYLKDLMVRNKEMKDTWGTSITIMVFTYQILIQFVKSQETATSEANNDEDASSVGGLPQPFQADLHTQASARTPTHTHIRVHPSKRRHPHVCAASTHRDWSSIFLFLPSPSTTFGLRSA